MAQLKKNKIVEVDWLDAVVYSATNKEKNMSVFPTAMHTKGILVIENSEGIIVKNPHSVYKLTKKRSRKEIKKKPTFLFIPHGMIEKIKIV